MGIEHIRKRPEMYIGRLASGENERDGLYTLLKIVFNPLIRQFRDGVADEISIWREKNFVFLHPWTRTADTGVFTDR